VGAGERVFMIVINNSKQATAKMIKSVIFLELMLNYAQFKKSGPSILSLDKPYQRSI
jgi:hypothetical protein